MFSKNRTAAAFAAILLAGVLASCARPAPSLPDAPAAGADVQRPVTGAVEVAKCEQLDTRLEMLDEEASRLEYEVRAKRSQNQAAGYFGGLFLVPLIAIDDQPAEKARLDGIQVERDDIYYEKRRLACPARPGR
ncbi:MAG: hypothetical protein JJ900_08615 [Rhodospirillales bacterium]|nr:hypothetical protein [Rhodospirillales bacterium]MBO6786900.1 hypothetical protein [Rhodospirillales bacterium]